MVGYAICVIQTSVKQNCAGGNQALNQARQAIETFADRVLVSELVAKIRSAVRTATLRTAF